MYTKKILALLLAALLLAAIVPAIAYADENLDEDPTDAVWISAEEAGDDEDAAEAVQIPAELNVVVSDWKVSFMGNAAVPVPAYNIDGNNYFKLRELGALTNSFDASYADGMILLQLGVPYTEDPNNPTGVPLPPSFDSIELSSDRIAIAVGATIIELEGVVAYKIDGSNYFRIRSLQEAINDAIGFEVILVGTPDDPAEHTIILDFDAVALNEFLLDSDTPVEAVPLPGDVLGPNDVPGEDEALAPTP